MIRWANYPASFGKSLESCLRISHQHTQHAVEVAVIEGMPGALQLIVVGEHLLGAGYVARGSFQFDGVGAEVNVDIQAVFEHMEIFIAGAEQGLDVTCEFNIFFHSELWRRLQQLRTGLTRRRLTRHRKDEMWDMGMRFIAGFRRTHAGVFCTQIAGCGSEANRIAHPDYGAVTKHLRSA